MQTRFQFVKVLVLVLLIGTMSLFFFTIGFADATASEDSTAAPAAVPTAPPVYTYLSSSSNSSVGGVSFQDEDIVRYNSVSGQWELFFDGSDVGVGSNDIDAFELKTAGATPLGFEIYMSFEKDIKNLSGLGLVRSRDIVKFTPSIIGSATAGTFSIFLQGDTVGLDTSNENIDAITFDPSGRLVVSTVGTASVPGLTAQDEDLIVWTGSAWQLYLDGSTFNMTGGNEDVNGAWIDPSGDKNIYLSTRGNFSASSNGTSASGDSDDIFGVSPASAAPVTSGFLFAHFDGDSVGFKKAIDGIFISFSGIPVSAAADSVNAAGTDDAAVVQYEVSSDEIDATDSEMDEFDAAVEDEAAEAQNKRLFVPVVFAR